MAVTWNPADKDPNITLSNGNLTATGFSINWYAVRATTSKSSGKWYFEISFAGGAANKIDHNVGVMRTSHRLNTYVGDDPGGWSHIGYGNGVNSGVVNFINNSRWPDGSTVQVAVDLDSNWLWMGWNNIWFVNGNPGNGTNPLFTGLSGEIFPACALESGTASITARFAYGDFLYAPPTGFAAWDSVPPISGTVYEKNESGVYVPGAYPVYLYNRATGALVSSTVSAEDGSYTLQGTEGEEYYIMAIDNSSPLQRSAIVDKVVPS